MTLGQFSNIQNLVTFFRSCSLHWCDDAELDEDVFELVIEYRSGDVSLSPEGEWLEE